VKSLNFADHHPIRIGGERERLVTASPVMTKSRDPAGGSNYPENGLVKPPRRDTRALSPAGMFGGKAPLRLAAQKSGLHAPSAPMRSAPAYFLCKWGVQTVKTRQDSVGRKHEDNTKPRKNMYCCGGAEESKGGYGDTAAAVAHVVKGGDGEEEEDVGTAAALPHAVAPVGAPSAAAAGLYCEWRGYSKSCCCAGQRRFRKDQVTRRDSTTCVSQRNMDRRRSGL
jgi:hypothetical protein